MKTPPPFQFTEEQQAAMREALKKRFIEEYDLELGNLQSDLFLDFLNENVGKYYYNLGIIDAIRAIKEKTDDLVLLIKE